MSQFIKNLVNKPLFWCCTVALAQLSGMMVAFSSSNLNQVHQYPSDVVAYPAPLQLDAPPLPPPSLELGLGMGLGELPTLRPRQPAPPVDPRALNEHTVFSKQGALKEII